jgi:hypothetical protein
VIQYLSIIPKKFDAFFQRNYEMNGHIYNKQFLVKRNGSPEQVCGEENKNSK